MTSPTGRLRGWGGFSVPGIERRGEDLRALTAPGPNGVPTLTRGLGRSYGDASLPPEGVREVVGSVSADRLIAFDAQTGVLRAEAGVSLDTIARVFLPHGWFSPVAPGTRYVTLGGMVASDVHGKNHHVSGTLGRHVRSLTIRVASGDIVIASREENADLFRATLGGMGLFGHVLEVELAMERVSSPWIWREQIQVPNFDALLDGLERSATWPQTVAWIDTLATGANFGRGVLMRGRWATRDEAPLVPPRPGLSPIVPFHAPDWALNDASMRAFNFAYYHKQLSPKVEGVQSPYGWYWPLDAVRHWYRAYGPSGFTQHQCVIPRAAGRGKVRELCERLARWGGTGFLCVIKDCGDEGEGVLSFPEPGLSVALDLPVRPGIQELIDRLNRFVLDCGGRIYLTKDAYTRRDDFLAMEARRMPAFWEARAQWDPHRRLRSALGDRLLDRP
jgi:decaprenylphospho-beta-D-ribofuranose 2-oxidase